MSGTIQSALDFAHVMLSNTLQCEGATTCILSNPLINRVTSNWKVLLMDCATVVAISCMFWTYINGLTVLCSAFTVISVAAAASSFYIRRFEAFQNLENTTRDLQETRQRLEVQVTNLHQETNRLNQANHTLEESNNTYRANNNQLTQQVAALRLQCTSLSQSAETIRDQVGTLRGQLQTFGEENTHLRDHVGQLVGSLESLEGRLSASRELNREVETHLGSLQEDLRQRCEQLGQGLQRILTDSALVNRLQALDILQQRQTSTTQQLQSVQLELARERGNFEALHNAWQQLKTDFEDSIHANNESFHQYIAMIQQVLNRYLPQALPSNPTLLRLLPSGNPQPVSCSSLP